jgi:hypothetical protein
VRVGVGVVVGESRPRSATQRNASNICAEGASEGTSEGTMSAEPFATAVCDIEMR